MLINIDNGGTLTDICVIDGARVYRTKTVTTPHDLSKCLFDGLRKAARTIYGTDDLFKLLRAASHIRYSTTQGTNALVERKGPRLGLILGGTMTVQTMQTDEYAAGLYRDLVGERTRILDASVGAADPGAPAIQAVNSLAAEGANRIIVAVGGTNRDSMEKRLKRTLLRAFPPHLLGAVPILYSHELSDDADDARRTWTALCNAFLHPSMERFLYSAEHKLREYRTRNPLLIFRNDGYSGRVARTIAIKTYSSGPRGGMEGARALAQHYGFARLVSMDVGGTTTDIGLVENGRVRALQHGEVEGVATSFPLCDVVSVGVGGSSILKVDGGRIRVGPESIGGAPGPACFALGGREATITDTFLVMGLLDPSSYFGGEMKIDRERARAAIQERIATPLGISVEEATAVMESAWVGKIAASLKEYTSITPDVTLTAFGGAGPFAVCKVAEAAGIARVIIPGLAAVFSAFGIGFSDIGHEFSATPSSPDAEDLATCRARLREQASRAMFAEGASLDECRVEETLSSGGSQLSLHINAVKPVPHAVLSGRFGEKIHAAVTDNTRAVLSRGRPEMLPLYRVEDQRAGAAAAGPAVLEEAFFTCRIDPGWRFELNDGGDILLTRDRG